MDALISEAKAILISSRNYAFLHERRPRPTPNELLGRQSYLIVGERTKTERISWLIYGSQYLLFETRSLDRCLRRTNPTPPDMSARIVSQDSLGSTASTVKKARPPILQRPSNNITAQGISSGALLGSPRRERIVLETSKPEESMAGCFLQYW